MRSRADAKADKATGNSIGVAGRRRAPPPAWPPELAMTELEQLWSAVTKHSSLEKLTTDGDSLVELRYN